MCEMNWMDVIGLWAIIPIVPVAWVAGAYAIFSFYTAFIEKVKK